MAMPLLASRQQTGASTSLAACGSHAVGLLRLTPRCRRPSRCRDVILCTSPGSSGSADDFVREARTAASRAFNKARGKWDTFAKQQRFEERANEALNQAGASAREAADKAKDKARRVFVQLDSEYELSAKTARAARRAEEVARDIDQTYGVRRRVRSASDYVVRSWPTWQRRLDEFGATWYGKVTFAAALCLLVSTPLFWGVLNVLLLLWWLCVPVAMLMLNAAREAEARRLQQQQEEEARRAANPFAQFFRGAAARASAGGGGGSRRAAGSPGFGRYAQHDGPVIEAEWTTIDESGAPGSGSNRGGRGKR